MKEYSLSELCQTIASALETRLSATYWVRAEISSLSLKGGHCYMELVEKANATGMLSAKVRAVCWANTYTMLSSYFMFQTGQSLQAGMQILIEASVSFHAVYGLSLQIENIDPAYTLGELARQRQLTIQRLQDEGVMDMNKLHPLPTVLQRIAVISSAEAAGYGDFCDQLQHNNYGFRFRTTLFPAIVQGDRAVASVISAFDNIYAALEADQQAFQTVVIIRGGGATTDLGCFDSYDLAFYASQFPLPVIAGIGHQRDNSVLDMVVYTSLKTPTAVAEFVINHNLVQLERLTRLHQRLLQTADKRILLLRHRLDKATMRLQMAFANRLRKEGDFLLQVEKTLLLRSPEKIYRMGYTLTRHNGKTVRSAAELQPGDRITTEWQDGTVTSVVEKA